MIKATDDLDLKSRDVPKIAVGEGEECREISQGGYGCLCCLCRAISW
jgi:hypothetical protein